MATPVPQAQGLPLAVRRYILTVAVVGVVVLLGSALVADGSTAGIEPLSVVVLIVLAITSILVPMRLRRGGGVEGWNLTVGVAVGLITVVPDWLALELIALSALIGSGIRTGSLVKAGFNAAQSTIWAFAAVVAGRLVLGGDVGGDVLTAGPALAVVAVVVTANVVNVLAMIELFHRLRGERRREAVRDYVSAATLQSLVGDTVVALLIVILVDRSSIALLLAAPLFAGLLFGFRGLEASRQSGRQARLLHETSRALLAGAVDQDRLRDAIDGLRQLFQAEEVTLVLAGDDPPPALSQVVAGVLASGRPTLDTDERGVIAAPVVLDGRIIGVLTVVGRRGLDDWGEADVELLGTVAGEVAATLRARQLFDDVERERASLAVESQRLGDILHGASDGILLLDDLGRVEACNPAMGGVLGALPEDVIGRRWDDVLRLEDDEGAPVHATTNSAFSRALAGLGKAVSELRLRQPDGGWRWVRCSVAPVRRDDELAGVVLVAVDLTSQREVEELRGDFLATVSHELRTPLTPLKGFLAMLETYGDRLPPDRLGSIHGSMGKQLDRLEDLIGDLLLVAELDGGAPRVSIEEVDLADVVADVLATEAPTDELQARLEVDVPSMQVLGDPPGLRRVLRSLVSNGLKHTEGAVRISAAIDGREVVVEVEDDGPGIPEADREVVFEPFRRLGNHLHRTQGPGLGLAIARSLTEAVGGSLELGRSVGAGARFVLRLPHDAVPASRGPRRPQQGGEHPPAR